MIAPPAPCAVLLSGCMHDARFSYWRGKKDREVDLVAEVNGQVIPFEVKYRAQHTGARELKGLIELCEQKRITRGYVVTKSLDDFGPMPGVPPSIESTTQIMRIRAPLLCYWMGASELDSTGVAYNRGAIIGSSP